MKVSNVLPLAALTSAFVLPQEEVLAGLTIEDHHGHTSVDDWVEKATVAWSDSHVINLGDVSFNGKALLVAIVGPVGCRKSTLLRALLGEANVL